MSYPKIPMRETCAVCGKVNRVGFHVPNAIWREAVHPSRVHDIHCLVCFTARADEKLLQWDEEIEFYPVSFRSHLGLLELRQ